MNKIRNFMIGRYGFDKLNLVLIILANVIIIISSIVNLSFGVFLAYAMFAWCIFRTLSKNIYKRQKESRIFYKYYAPIDKFLYAKINEFKQRKTHKFYKCTNCKQRVRVPKGRGKIAITCPKCKNKFIKKA